MMIVILKRSNHKKQEYNDYRPHRSLGDLTSAEYAEQFCAVSQSQKSREEKLIVQNIPQKATK